MGFAQDLIDEIEYDKYVENREIYSEVVKEVEEELHNAIQQELSGTLDYNRSAQRLIDQVK
jgi:hypothetical protein